MRTPGARYHQGTYYAGAQVFTLTIHTDNAAFDRNTASEVARILQNAAYRIEGRGELSGKLFDANGNHVGDFDFMEEAHA